MSGRQAPAELSVREAAQRYLRRRRADATDASVKSWKYRLKLFVEWCEGIRLDHVGQLRGYDIDEYYEIRSANVAPATLEGEMWTLRMFAEYLEQIDAVEDGLSESVRIPDINPEDRADETSLTTPAAIRLIEYYRASEQDRATRAHAFLELAWFTGARQSGLRALDVRDLNARVDEGEQSWVEFRHRPDTKTPLKNNRRGERPVGVPDEVARVVSEYVRENRFDVRDDHGRKPLIASAKGRPTENTVRVWSYGATQPCVAGGCPHDKDPDTCEWTQYAHLSKCPSSRSPHPIRTGSITWQLNQGIPPEVVAERVDATVKTIENHYDWASQEDRWRRYRDRMEQRQDYVEQLKQNENFDNERN
ncbi:integrase-like protein [Halorubrum aidingense JCM 13560]|uniref:Integrase-like protein n=1 Tax=Halorubrum aidingense JCM 13560 TaxID=1230454 RepID=M0PDK4_9EURY|nr:tyrosine-type recombinase/integrase [Halorubrum aidingense]EMA67599.1 integrase-like protein [Halorubrum aidingense JCM 13560]